MRPSTQLSFIRRFEEAFLAAMDFLADLALRVAEARFRRLGSKGLVTVVAANRCNSGVDSSSCWPLFRIAPATFVTTTPVAATAAAPRAAPATVFTASAASENLLFFAMVPPRWAPPGVGTPRLANASLKRMFRFGSP